MYQYPFETPQAREEKRQVYRILKEYFIDTDAWAWLKTYDSTEDGRTGFLAVHQYFSGPGERKKRITHFQQTIKGLFYKHGSSFSFLRFSAAAITAFETLGTDEDERYSEKQKVEWLQNAVVSTDEDIRTHVQLIFANYPRDFTGALAYLLAEISRKYAVMKIKEKAKARSSTQRISDVETGRGGRGSPYCHSGGCGGGQNSRGSHRGKVGHSGSALLQVWLVDNNIKWLK